jgi:GT2 family glycosyltransferase
MSRDAAPIATIMIVTKNRIDDLRQAVASATAQTGAIDVLIIDDGSTDGTSRMIASEFPGVTLVTHAQSQGLVVRRNQGVTASRSNVVISIDDDAVLTAPDIATRTVKAFEDAHIGAIAMPYANIKRSPQLHQLAPDDQDVYVTDTFIGTAHAVRRDVFVQLGGYREGLFHQGEEADYCIRMLAAGHAVRLGSGSAIHHFESPRRDFTRMDHYGPRNAVLFIWQNVPLASALLQGPLTIGGVLMHTLDPRRLVTRTGGVIDGLVSCLREERAPVSADAFALWRRLRQASPPLRLRDIAPELAASG